MSAGLADPGAQCSDTRNMTLSIRGGKNAGRAPFGQGSGAIWKGASTLLGGEIPADAPGDPCRGVLDRIPRQVRIPGGRLNLLVTQQLPDHREVLIQGQRPRRIRMPKIAH